MPKQRRLLANWKLCQLITHDEKSLHDAPEPGGMHDNSVGGFFDIVSKPISLEFRMFNSECLSV
jgi:hypothetical protein